MVMEFLHVLPKKIISLPFLLLMYLLKGLYQQWLFDTLSDILSKWRAPMWLINLLTQRPALTGFIVFLTAFIIITYFVIKEIKYKTTGLYIITRILKRHKDINYQIGHKLKQVDVTGLLTLDKLPTDFIPIKDFHYKPTTNINKVKKQTQTAANSFEEQSKEYKEFIESLPVIEGLTSVLDIGFGLKDERNKNHDYQRVTKSIDDYYETYSYAINDRLDKLIQLHIEVSEATTALIIIERVPLLTQLLNTIAPDQAKLEILVGAEKSCDRASRRIRVRIGECIQQIEKERNASEKQITNRKPKGS